uniref:Uncharacterized protein n=1 Tax=Timema shepardi TaxID=629360 RepID=A0A7R9ATJ7_TIMSH|nr:unnamed protein product [Timema shepardi]
MKTVKNKVPSTQMLSNTRGTHLSLATTIPSSWSSSPSMVRAKLTMVTLLNTSGKKWGLRSLETIEKIKENIGDSYFWASVDETIDRCGRYIANIVVIQTFDEEDAVSIREAKFATSSSTVVSDLVHVKSYSGNLPGVIVSLEARDLPLIESVKIMNTIQEDVTCCLVTRNQT